MQRPLFILAPLRSFTSISCAMIGNHPELYGLPETNLFAAERVDALLRIHARQRRFAFGLLRAVADLDGDCAVSFTDLAALKGVFFGTDPDADLDGDGNVSFSDLGIMKSAFFGTPGPSAIATCP